MNSDISEMPGPDVQVIALAPAQPAPTAMPIAASSSSAWTTAYVALFVSGSMRNRPRYPHSASDSEDDGVMRCQVSTLTPATTYISASDKLPSMVILPEG